MALFRLYESKSFLNILFLRSFPEEALLHLSLQTVKKTCYHGWHTRKTLDALDCMKQYHFELDDRQLCSGFFQKFIFCMCLSPFFLFARGRMTDEHRPRLSLGFACTFQCSCLVLLNHLSFAQTSQIIYDHLYIFVQNLLFRILLNLLI